MSTLYYYEFWIGTKKFSRYGLDDRKARKLFSRYLRIQWNLKSQKQKDYYNHFAVSATISRIATTSGMVIPNKEPIYIESFDADEISIIEFYRVWK